MCPRKEVDKLWSNSYRDNILAVKQAKKRESDMLRMRRIRAEKKAEAAAAEDESGPPVTKKARVRGSDGNTVDTSGKNPNEIHVADLTKSKRKRKTATKSDKPSEVGTQATRNVRTNADLENAKKISKDNTMNDNENLDTQNEADGSFASPNVDKVPEKDKDRASNILLMNGNKSDSQLEGRTLRRKNKVEEKNIGTTDSLSLEPELVENTTKKVLVKCADGDMINAADKAPTPIDIAVSTESEDKASTENLSTAQDDKITEVEPQATRSLSATSCLINQPLVVILSHPISNNNLSQEISNNTASLSVFGLATATTRTSSVPGGTVITHEIKAPSGRRAAQLQGYPEYDQSHGHDDAGATRTSTSQDQTATTQSYNTQEGSFCTDGE